MAVSHLSRRSAGILHLPKQTFWFAKLKYFSVQVANILSLGQAFRFMTLSGRPHLSRHTGSLHMNAKPI